MTAPDMPHGGHGHGGHGGGLGKQIGPLPAGVWAASIAGGLLLALYLRRHQATPTAAQLDAANLPADNTSTAAGAGNLYAPDTATTDAGSSGGINVAAPQTNDQWSQVAERLLIGRGFQPLLVDAALSAYLTGQTLTTSQRAVITEALIVAGPPPSPPPPPLPGTSPDPTHAPIVPGPVAMPVSRPAHPEPLGTPRGARQPETYHPAAPNRYTIRAGDTLGKIAARHHTTAGALYSKNAAVLDAAAHAHHQPNSRRGGLLYPGTVIVL